MTDIYSGQFNGNILLVGRTGCGKTTFLEKLAINKFFGDIVKTEWISGIEIDASREAEIQSCFSNETEVHIATEKDKLDELIDNFKLKAQENKEIDNVNLSNSFGEIKKMDHLIVLDDVSGVADLSKKFANFLTVSRKFGYNCVYVFHVVIPSNQISQKIISQTNIFNIFPALCHSIQYQKFYKQTVYHAAKVIFQFVNFGLTGFLQILPTVMRKTV